MSIKYGWKMKLFTWLLSLGKKGVRKEYMRAHRCDIKCPNCMEWFSVSGIDSKHEHLSSPDFGFHIKCGKCGSDSYWNTVAAPVPLRCNDKGDPL